MSKPASVSIVLTPVSLVARHDRPLDGAAPRQRGSSDGWTLMSSWSESSGSLMSAPNAQTATTSGSRGGDRAQASGSLTFCGWKSSMPSSRAASATGGGGELAPAAGLAVGAGDDELRAVVGGREARQHLRRERRRAEEDGSHATRRSRPARPRAARASRPCAARASCGRGSGRRRGGRSRAG